MTQFLTQSSPIPPYMAFPRFLLDKDGLNETAKILYTILLDRARLSQKNDGWTDEQGHVFIFFPIKSLAETMHKSEMSVKTALNALEKENLIARKRQGAGFPNRIYVKYPPEALNQTDRIFSVKQTEKAHEYVSHWEEMKANSLGLLLWGDVGTGKSFFAGCIANALLDKGIPILMTNFSRILNTLTGIYSDDRNQFIDSFNKYSLLIIDDLGIERSSEFALEQVFNVIDSRYRSKKPLIVTTNLTLDELKHPKDLARARIYDRVLERCVPLKINNQNIRELNAAANMQEARKILNSGT